MDMTKTDENSEWLRQIVREASQLAIASQFSDGTQIDLGILREISGVFADTGHLDRAAAEASLRRLRTAAAWKTEEEKRWA
jgi:hypothetical protein